MDRTTPRELAAHRAGLAAHVLRDKLIGDVKPQMGLVLDTGFDDALQLKQASRIPFSCIEDLKVCSAPYSRDHQIAIGTFADVSVIALQGHVRLNAHPTDPRIPLAVRLQVEMLARLGVQRFIFLSGARSLGGMLHVGDIMIVKSFLSLFAPPMPLMIGDGHPTPEDHLSVNLALLAGRTVEMVTPPGVYAMVRGPQAGSSVDKQALSRLGADCVGMSVYPEVCVLTALDSTVRLICLSLITNEVYEIHADDTNKARVRAAAPKLRVLFKALVRQMMTP